MNSSQKQLIVITLLISAAAGYYFWPLGRVWSRDRVPSPARQRILLDQDIDKNWIGDGSHTVDALDFFEAGGSYVDVDADASEHVDRDVMLPLVK